MEPILVRLFFVPFKVLQIRFCFFELVSYSKLMTPPWCHSTSPNNYLKNIKKQRMARHKQQDNTQFNSPEISPKQWQDRLKILEHQTSYIQQMGACIWDTWLHQDTFSNQWCKVVSNCTFYILITQWRRGGKSTYTRRPVKSEAMKVPSIANVTIAPKFEKNGFW